MTFLWNLWGIQAIVAILEVTFLGARAIPGGAERCRRMAVITGRIAFAWLVGLSLWALLA